MKKMLSRSALHAGLLLCACAVLPASAQDSAPPADMPPEIAEMFADAAGEGATVTVAESEQPQDPGAAVGADLVGSRYLYTTLRVTTSGANRGCGVSDWNCMTRLCKADLGQSAWRGWAGCWRDGNNFICYFECGQSRTAF
jgi:hypothetical protein